MSKSSNTKPVGKETGEIGGILDENYQNNEIQDVEVHTDKESHEKDDTRTTGEGKNKLKQQEKGVQI